MWFAMGDPTDAMQALGEAFLPAIQLWLLAVLCVLVVAYLIGYANRDLGRWRRYLLQFALSVVGVAVTIPGFDQGQPYWLGKSNALGSVLLFAITLLYGLSPLLVVAGLLYAVRRRGAPAPPDGSKPNMSYRSPL